MTIREIGCRQPSSQEVMGQRRDMDEAIAMRDPELAYTSTARVEVQAIETSESETGFVSRRGT